MVLMQDEAYIRIPLRRRDGLVVAYTVIDAEDEHITASRWRLLNRGYAVRGERAEMMHRVICGLERGDFREVDHIDGDKLNNRRVNLRIVTRAQNGQNKPSYKGSSSRYRGVVWRKDAQKWHASVRVEGRLLHLGFFLDEDEAGEVASRAREQHFPYTNELRRAESSVRST